MARRALARLAALTTATAALALGPVAAGEAAAATPPPLTCSIDMTTHYTYNLLTGGVSYAVLQGGGTCVQYGGGSYTATVLGGVGSSHGLGPGTNCPTTSASDFTMQLDLSLTNAETQLITFVHVTLAAPGPDDMPGIQPVTATSNGQTLAGVYGYRLYHQCAPGGNDATGYDGLIGV